MPERMKASSPEGMEMQDWLYLLNIMVNPQMFFDITEHNQLDYLPDLEKEVYIQDILNNMQRIIDE